jgi:Protein of unknown function (DUF3131)
MLSRIGIALLVLLVGPAAAAPRLEVSWDGREAWSAARGAPPGLSGAGIASFAAAAEAEPARPDSVPNEREFFLNAARVAWRYVQQQTHPETGLVNSVVGYPYTTVWDMGSALAALYCADQLDIISGEEYDQRLKRLLGTMQRMPLFENAAFGKNYSTERAAMVDRDNKPSERGTSVTVTDMGRLLIWLKIIRDTQPQYAEAVDAVTGRFDLKRFVRDGYLYGIALDRAGRLQPYQEGRLGYEQYAAAGFEMWGSPARRSLDLKHNAQEVTVQGVTLLADRRRGEYLASEPFVLAGMELGWYPELRNQAWRILAAQEARFRQTGQVTIASEDAINQPPYFLYYSVYTDGRPFAVLPPEGSPRGELPRTVSTKAAFAWHALLPSSYTWQAVRSVQPAAGGTGWGSGVYESDLNRSTGAENINTTAVVLESALYYMRGRPLIEGVRQ